MTTQLEHAHRTGAISTRHYQRAAGAAGREASTPAPSEAISEGDVFVSQWGYDQTNVDFFEVVCATAKTVTLRPIRSRVIGEAGFMSEHVEPVPGEYTGEPFRRKVHHYSDRPAVAINSCANAYPWNGAAQTASHYA